MTKPTKTNKAVKQALAKGKVGIAGRFRLQSVKKGKVVRDTGWVNE